jgi:hypothetical protein
MAAAMQAADSPPASLTADDRELVEKLKAKYSKGNSQGMFKCITQVQ